MIVLAEHPFVGMGGAGSFLLLFMSIAMIVICLRTPRHRATSSIASASLRATQS